MSRIAAEIGDRVPVDPSAARATRRSGDHALSGRYPVGETERAKAPATLPMRVRSDLRELLREEST